MNNRYLKLGLLVIAPAVVAAGFIWLSARPPAGSEAEIIARRGIHWHYTFAVYIYGQKQAIPAGIGLGPVEQPVHTHEPDGVIHLEFPGVVRKSDTRLGKFFKVWGKKFSKDCIFDYCNEGAKKVKFIVNGAENFDFENYETKDGDQIEIRYE